MDQRCATRPRKTCGVAALMQKLPIVPSSPLSPLLAGAMYDDVAATPEQHGLSIAALMDEKLARDSPDQITVLLDVRGGPDWPNPPAYNMLTPIRTIIGMLSANFPERCLRVVVYPMPWGVLVVSPSPVARSHGHTAQAAPLTPLAPFATRASQPTHTTSLSPCSPYPPRLPTPPHRPTPHGRCPFMCAPAPRTL